jgi:hypothetical protein
LSVINPTVSTKRCMIATLSSSPIHAVSVGRGPPVRR